MTKCDILFITVPYTGTDDPLQAPSVLKAVVESKGFTARTHDVNHDFISSNHQYLDAMKQYFAFGTTSNSNIINHVYKYVNSVAESLLEKYNPTFVGMSVFTYQCQVFTKMLSLRLKELEPAVKIILGGQGLTTQGIQSKDSWAKILKEQGIIDHYIISEGEEALITLLQNGKGTGIDGEDWKQKSNLDDIPYPNYDDYDLQKYGDKKIMITGSRGCVRKCTFCDIHKHWQKFVFRSGRSIADEMIFQSQRYKIYDFGFTDSLINGSMKAYRDMITILAEHNSSTDKKLTWGGQFIVRGIKSMTEDDWRLTKASGARSLALGIESGSESVRNHMKKQFSDKELDEFMEQAYRNDVSVTFLMIIGYPTETETDFIQTLRMFKKYIKYQKIISSVVLGTTLGILPGTPLAEDMGDKISLNNGENFWIYKKNPTLDFRERIKRRIIIGEELSKMGYNITGNDDNYKLLHYLWNIYTTNQKQNVIDMNTSSLAQQKYS
jgi:radical SAM superfamily enzyme YgiQ (UPF0313 family)